MTSSGKYDRSICASAMRPVAAITAATCGTCVEAEAAVETVVDVPARHRQRPPDAVHVCQREADVVELVQCLHVERPVVVVVRSCVVLPLSGHVDVRSTCPLPPPATDHQLGASGLAAFIGPPHSWLMPHSHRRHTHRVLSRRRRQCVFGLSTTQDCRRHKI